MTRSTRLISVVWLAVSPYQTRCSSAVGSADRYLDPSPDRRVVCPIGNLRSAGEGSAP
jgi:hypothetical protein